MDQQQGPNDEVDRIPVTIDPGSPEAGRGGVVQPPETRFKPGQSGNPKGRPKGALTSFDCLLEQELERMVDGDESLGDNGRISRRRRLVRSLLDSIERGDYRAAKPFLDRIWPQVKEETGGGGVVLLFDAQDRDA